MEKERADYWAKDTIELVIWFETLDDILQEWLDFCRGELIGGGYGCGKEWCRERGEGQERANKFDGSNLASKMFR